MKLQEIPQYVIEHRRELVVFGGIVTGVVFAGWQLEKHLPPNITLSSDSTPDILFWVGWDEEIFGAGAPVAGWARVGWDNGPCIDMSDPRTMHKTGKLVIPGIPACGE